LTAASPLTEPPISPELSPEKTRVKSSQTATPCGQGSLQGDFEKSDAIGRFGRSFMMLPQGFEENSLCAAAGKARREFIADGREFSEPRWDFVTRRESGVQ
jgi:hypothetical protein